jgi:YidC/Oxa1 family membrane protein insertase
MPTLPSKTLVPKPITLAPVAATPPTISPVADDVVTQVTAMPPSETLETLVLLMPLQSSDLTALRLTRWSLAGLSS